MLQSRLFEDPLLLIMIKHHSFMFQLDVSIESRIRQVVLDAIRALEDSTLGYLLGATSSSTSASATRDSSIVGAIMSTSLCIWVATSFHIHYGASWRTHRVSQHRLLIF